MIARLISRDDMGALAVLMVMTNGCGLLAALGVGSTTTKFVASFEGAGNLKKMRQAGYECVAINLLGTIVLAAVLFLMSDFFAAWLLGSAMRGGLVRLLVLEVGASSMLTALSSIITGLRKFKEYSLTIAGTFVVRQGLVVLFLLLGFGVGGVVVGWGLGDSLTVAILALFTRKLLGPVRFGFGFLRLIKFSAPLFLSDGANYAWGYFDRVLLIPLVSLSQLGSYNVAVTAFGILNAFSASFSSTLLPFYSHFYADGTKKSQRAALEVAVNSASRYVAFFTVPLAVGLAATALPAVKLLAGSVYADAAIPLAVLSISLALACQLKALSSVFVVLERPVTSALVTLASIVIPILVGVVLIPTAGTVGAAIVRGASLVLALVFSILILGRMLKVTLDLRAYLSSLIAAAAMSAVVIVAQLVFYSEFLLPVYALIGAVIFAVALRLTRTVSEADLQLASEFLGPRLTFATRILTLVFGERKVSGK